ncbi:hypothetical protein [Micromonospora sp. DT62]|uniref:hypothetical protein n=1 Tax=Micromonospora sp. DT62 TaxID=3416521 RepID=UPI003CE95D8A
MRDKRELLFSFLGKETISPAANKAGGSVKKLGDNLQDTEDAAKKLDREMDLVKGSLADLAVQFARTDDAAQRVDLVKGMRDQQRELSKLVKAKKFLPDLSDAGDSAAKGFAASFVGRLGPLVASAPLGPAGAAAGGVLAASAAPVIGGAVAAALVGGAATGGVIGGLTLAAKDPRVKAAGSSLGQAVMDDLEDFSEVFVSPAVEGIGIIRQEWKAASGDVKGILDASARYVVPLTRGLTGLAREALPGIREAVVKAAPVIREISTGLPRLGRAIGDVFSDSADNADDAAAAIHGVFLALEQVVRIGGTAVNTLTSMVEPVAKVGQATSRVQDFLLGWIPGLGEVTNSWVENWDSMANAHNEATAEMARQQDFLRKNLGASADAARGQASALDELADELRAQTDPAFALIEAQNDLKEAQQGYNEAVSEHGRKSPEAQEALRKMALAAIAVQSATGAAAGTMNGSLSPALLATLRSAGFTEAELRDLEKQFKTAKAAGEKFAKNYQATVTTVYREVGRAVPITNEYQSGIGGRAKGGPVKAGTPYIVGEEGPELITPSRDGYVHTAKETARMMAGSRSAGSPMAFTGGHPSEQTVRLIIEGTGVLDGLRKEIKIQGGDVQTVLGV